MMVKIVESTQSCFDLDGIDDQDIRAFRQEIAIFLLTDIRAFRQEIAILFFDRLASGVEK